VNKIKVEDKERILKRGQVSLLVREDGVDGQVIHERLEREIHPEEILVVTETREDVWGLRYVSPLRYNRARCSLDRFITMLSGMQSLLDLGVCREMPVVGFINGVLILGIIVSPYE
jgi:exonuclease V